MEENAEVLARIAEGGANLVVPREVDFSHLFYEQGLAEQFQEAAERAGYAVRWDRVVGESGIWDITASKVLVPSTEAITQAEAELDALAVSLGGHSDGWGFED